MAPALTAEPLSPKEKLTGNASPATGTRQSVRKLDSPSDTAKKPISLTATTRVTRSKDAAQRTGSPIVQVNNNNKRKPNNHSSNNNSSCNSTNNEAKSVEHQMGLSAATTHTNSDGSAAASSSSSSSNINDAGETSASATVDNSPAEHNNNCKDNSTAELLANLTSELEEAITAEICLRKTLPEVSHSKEQPAETEAAAAAAIAHSVQLLEPALMAETESQSQSTSAAAAAAAVTTPTPAAATTTFTDALQRLSWPEIPLTSNADGVAELAAAAAAKIPDSIEGKRS